MEELQQSVSNKKIKIKIDSDRACYILGEVWKGMPVVVMMQSFYQWVLDWRRYFN
jgi:hypothetical protein